MSPLGSSRNTISQIRSSALYSILDKVVVPEVGTGIRTSTSCSRIESSIVIAVVGLWACCGCFRKCRDRTYGQTIVSWSLRRHGRAFLRFDKALAHFFIVYFLKSYSSRLYRKNGCSSDWIKCNLKALVTFRQLVLANSMTQLGLFGLFVLGTGTSFCIECVCFPIFKIASSSAIPIAREKFVESRENTSDSLERTVIAWSGSIPVGLSSIILSCARSMD
jgi:hypothetical protein